MKNIFSRFKVNPAAGMLPSNFTSPDAFTTDDGNSETFAAGDTCFVAKGTRCT